MPHPCLAVLVAHRTAALPVRISDLEEVPPPPPASAGLPRVNALSGAGTYRPAGTPSSSSSVDVESDEIFSVASIPVGQLTPAFAELLCMYPLHYDVFAPFADMRITAHYATAFMFPAASEPSRVTWDAMREYLPNIHFSLNPAGRGAMFLRFSTLEDRDAAVDFPGAFPSEDNRIRWSYSSIGETRRQRDVFPSATGQTDRA
ncbi:hypothetical protein OsJ_26025 [Oryza sativa Japonica Group]|uniref:Uncharacterized protein n=1 Tax=Oryza sativa subsp. japonica TaxID=39947 RepID=B9FZ17_ORYSJ|nr:hypothetical protein OsJ_26025 [Oryza sativa Japonica Group]